MELMVSLGRTSPFKEAYACVAKSHICCVLKSGRFEDILAYTFGNACYGLMHDYMWNEGVS